MVCVTIAIVHSAAPLQHTVIPEALELILHYKTSRNFFLHKVSAKEQLLDQRIRFSWARLLRLVHCTEAKDHTEVFAGKAVTGAAMSV